MRILVVLALVAIGCGHADDGDPLDGTAWVIESTTSYCGQGLKFEAGTYRELVMCYLTDGSIGIQEWNGPYTVSGDQLTLQIERASCNWYPGQSETLTWAINGAGNLSLQDSAGVVVMQPITAGGGTFSGVFGCFDADLVFTPMPVHTL